MPANKDAVVNEDFSGLLCDVSHVIEEDFSFSVASNTSSWFEQTPMPLAAIENTPVRKRKVRNKGKKNPHPKRSKLEVQEATVKQVYLSLCCKEHCLNSFSSRQITEARQEFWSRSRQSQRKFIYKGLRARIDTNFIVDGKRLCEKGWCSMYGIKDRRFRAIRSKLLKGVAPQDDREMLSSQSRRYLMAKTWLGDYVRLLSDKQPNKEERHLPSCLTKEWIHKTYAENMTKAQEIPLSHSAFKEMWLKEFQDVKISKGKGNHFQCTHCNNYTTSLLKQNVGKSTEGLVVEMRTQHLNLQTICREKYYKHIKKARLNPEKYISLIIDNMDSGKTKLPRYTTNVKADASLSTMQHHVTGVKCHGQGRTYVFTWTDALKCDCNITINCLLYVLLEISKEQGCMPETLYIQADNSGKDNKNNYVILFLAYMVFIGIFKKIKLNFLMVGHTHEDIDAVFSRIGKQLRQTNAPTLGKLHQAISICMEPAPIVNHFSSVLDYRSKCLESDTHYSGFQGVHHFTFKMDQDRLQMKYKDWPSDEYSKLDMTDCVGKLDFRFVPNASLNEKVLNVKECLSKDLEKYGQAGRMEVDDQEWWAAYLNGIERACRMPPITPGICQLPKFKEANGTTIVSNTLTALRDHQKKISQKSVIKTSKKK